MPESYWIEMRCHYLIMTELLRYIDEQLSFLILLSCANNLFYICFLFFNNLEYSFIGFANTSLTPLTRNVSLSLHTQSNAIRRDDRLPLAGADLHHWPHADNVVLRSVRSRCGPQTVGGATQCAVQGVEHWGTPFFRFHQSRDGRVVGQAIFLSHTEIDIGCECGRYYQTRYMFTQCILDGRHCGYVRVGAAGPSGLGAI